MALFVADLAALAAETPAEGKRVYVRTIGAPYDCVLSSLGTTPTTVIASTDGTLQWIRDLSYQNPKWQRGGNPLFVSVDPQNVSGVASDENGLATNADQATADLHPFLSFEELWRRWNGIRLTDNVIVHLMSSMGAGTGSTVPPDSIGSWQYGTGGITPEIHIWGEPTVVHSGTITNVQKFTYGGHGPNNGKYVISDSAYDFTGHVSTQAGQGYQLKRTNGTAIYSMTMTLEAIHDVAINLPCTNNPAVPSYPEPTGDWVIGDTYALRTFPTVYDMGTGNNVRVSYSQVNLGKLGFGQISIQAPRIMRLTYTCFLENAAIVGYVLAAGPLFTNICSFSHGRWDLNHVGAIGPGDNRLLFINGLAHTIRAQCDGVRQYVSNQGSLRISGAGMYNVRYGGGQESAPPSCFTIDETGCILFDDGVRGHGNQATIFSAQTPNGQGIYGTEQCVGIELHTDYTDKVAQAFYYSGPNGTAAHRMVVGWNGLPLQIRNRGACFIGSGNQ